MTAYQYNSRQKDLITAQLLNRDSSLNLNGLYSFVGDVEERNLEVAVRRLYDSFSSMRHVARRESGDYVPMEDTTGLKLQKSRIDDVGSQYEYIRVQARKPFDLFEDAPMRAEIINGATGPAHLFLQFHHVATDWWSFHQVHSALVRAYLDPDVEIEDTVSAYNAFDSHRSARDVEEAETIWSRTLSKHVDVFDVEFDRTRHFERSVSTVAGTIEEYARSNEMTLFEALFIAFAETLAKDARQSFIVNTPVGNRTEPQYIRTVGYLMNVVPILCEVRRGVLDVPATLHNLRMASAYGFVPRSRLAQLMVANFGNSVPLKQIVFMFLRDGMSEQELPGGAVFTRVYPEQDEDQHVVTVREHQRNLKVVMESQLATIAGQDVQEHLRFVDERFAHLADVNGVAE
ncbi:condensation domain-containing protein [Corynebacterium glyciniphilum]|uniref:condensation domain-containing protein n=1 Tax=Corynebacterium glyciniphilum TaxID=1404244 RepID=UPI0026549B9E|nr:condensation domain-containing protein [Corynebacterium glyciniphilum]MDN6704603.1 condensation domain-containing protein [Corynebacterium glyciniphilum]